MSPNGFSAEEELRLKDEGKTVAQGTAYVRERLEDSVTNLIEENNIDYDLARVLVVPLGYRSLDAKDPKKFVNPKYSELQIHVTDGVMTEEGQRTGSRVIQLTNTTRENFYEGLNEFDGCDQRYDTFVASEEDALYVFKPGMAQENF